MEENEVHEQVCGQLQIVDESIWYLILIIVSILLSFYSVKIQRQQLVNLITPECCQEKTPDIFPIKLVANVLVLISLYFFFNLSASNLNQNQENEVLCNSNKNNYTASFLVLLAAIIRFFDIIYVKVNAERPAQEQDSIAINDTMEGI